jgi:fermentation-respiration switch protein FrsA (DUF1100 family)
MAAAGALAAVAAATSLIALGPGAQGGGGAARRRSAEQSARLALARKAAAADRAGSARRRSHARTRAGGSGGEGRTPPYSHAPYAVGTLTLHLVDRSRTIELADGRRVPRELTTIVRYPALGPTGHERTPATPAGSDGPFPLIIFGHGFDVGPELYAQLLRYWTSSGFVVAAPIFPRENPAAPGGPNESDLPNQPADMSYVISSLLAASGRRSGPLSGLINPREIAVAGQSDGGDTALAVAYDPSYRDRRVGAAVILSGAEIPMVPAFTIAPGGPPLLATQGTADNINPPAATEAFFGPAPAPKFLLWLLGAGHLPPYSSDRAQLGVVERVTTAFLEYYLEHRRSALSALERAGHAAGLARLVADP